MNEIRWKLKTFPGKVKPRTGYVLEHVVAHCVLGNPIWRCVTIEDSKEETLVFDQYPLGQAVPKIMDKSDLVDDEEE